MRFPIFRILTFFGRTENVILQLDTWKFLFWRSDEFSTTHLRVLAVTNVFKVSSYGGGLITGNKIIATVVVIITSVN